MNSTFHKTYRGLELYTFLVSGQLHAPAVLHMGKEHLVTFG